MAMQWVQESTTVPTRGQRIVRSLYRLCKQLGTLLLRYWAHMLTWVLGLIVLIALLISILSYLGLDVMAKPLFFALHAICAQIPSHSFYLFGHQLGLCVRNLFIYGSMFLGGLVFVLSKKTPVPLRAFSWYTFASAYCSTGQTYPYNNFSRIAHSNRANMAFFLIAL